MAVVSGSGAAEAEPVWAVITWRIAATDSASEVGSTRMILPIALPTGSAASAAPGRPSSTAITRPSASAADSISGGSRVPRPSR
jgi:hypothetical protein